MGGPVLIALIAATLCAVDARPQSVDGRLSIQTSSQSEYRDSLLGSSSDQRHAPSSAANPRTQKPGSGAYKDDPYTPRAHHVQNQQPPYYVAIDGSQPNKHPQDANRYNPRNPERDVHDPWTSNPQQPITDKQRLNHYSPPQGAYTTSSGANAGKTPTVAFPQENRKNITRREPAKEEIVFPGPTKMSGKFVPDIGGVGPNCAQGSTFCESTDNYPSEYLSDVLKLEGNAAFKEFFGIDDNELSHRIDSDSDLTGEQMCTSVEQIVYPKMAQNKQDKWLFVVNQDQYVQGVRVEKCREAGSECKFAETFPLGYKTSCQQKFIFRRLLALNEDGKTHTDSFRLPSCCACHVKAVGAS